VKVVKIAALLFVVLGLVLAAAVGWVTRRSEGQRFASGDVEVHYTDEGQGSPVVLLHGFAVNADLNWRLPGLTDLLTSEFRVLAMDLRGHGLSDKPHDPTQYGDAMANDVVALLDHLGLARAQVVGYSLGGVVALQLATTHPERLRSVALLGAGWEDPEDSQFLAALEGIAGELEAGHGVPPLAASLGGDREPPGFLHTTWVRLATRYLNDGPALAAMVRGLRGLAVERDALGRIRVPMLAIVGTEDPMLAGVDAMVGLVPDLTVVRIDGADHVTAARRPEMTEALLGFLRQHEAAQGG